MEIRIAEERVENLDSYASIPISFVVRSRMDLDQLWLGEYAEIPVEPRTKDYDSLESVTSLSDRFDVSNWALIRAEVPQDDHLVGGAIIAIRTSGLDMLEGRDDLAILWDIRVHPIFRGQGVGRVLFERAKKWAKSKGCKELRVETQDTNVEACRFYRIMGCRIHSIHEDAYEGLNEAKILWTCKT